MWDQMLFFKAMEATNEKKVDALLDIWTAWADAHHLIVALDGHDLMDESAVVLSGHAPPRWDLPPGKKKG